MEETVVEEETAKVPEEAQEAPAAEEPQEELGNVGDGADI